MEFVTVIMVSYIIGLIDTWSQYTYDNKSFAIQLHEDIGLFKKACEENCYLVVYLILFKQF